MPEKGAADQCFIECSAVHRDKRLLSARAASMDGFSDQFLAGATFSMDQDSCIRLGYLADFLVNFEHGGIFAYQVFEAKTCSGSGRGILQQFLMLDNLVQLPADHVHVEGFENVVISPGFDRLDCLCRRIDTCEHQHECVGEIFSDLSK